MSAGYPPPADQPLADYYQMLGVVHFESDPHAIHVAADGRIIHVRSFQSGPHVEQIVQELNQARSVLLDPQLKAIYDAQLSQQLYPPAAASPAPSSAFPGHPHEYVNQAPTSPLVTGAESPSLNFESAPESSSAPRPRRRRSKRSLLLVIGLNILGPVLGLCGGYAILCWISPRYDFLHLLPAEQVPPPVNVAPEYEPAESEGLEDLEPGQ